MPPHTGLPLPASLLLSPANPASADALAQDIFLLSKQQICNNNHKLQNDAVQLLSWLTRGLMRIITHDTLSPTRKVIAQHHFAVCGCYCKFVVLTNFFNGENKADS